MAKSPSGFSFSTLLLLLTVLPFTLGLKFDLLQGTKERCIRNFVNRDTLVVVTSTIDGFKGDGMVVNMHVSFDRILGDGVEGAATWRASFDVLGM